MIILKSPLKRYELFTNFILLTIKLFVQAVEKMEEKLEAAYGDQKRIFLIIFQRFIMILSEHLVKCDTDGRDFNTDWYRWTIGRLQQVFLVVSC